MEFRNKKVAILGYGLEGQDAEKHLKEKGVESVILDKKFDEKYLANLSDFDIVVRSPGVYRYLPEIVAAEKSGVVITSPVKIFFEECPGKIIGVTGTKGKGTTSTLIYEILKEDGRDIHLAGNIGKPYLELLPKLNKNSWVVMELSSFQLIDMEKSPHIAVVLNITSDHLDWHKDIGEYINSKKNIVKHQLEGDLSVINYDFETPKSFADLGQGDKYFFSKFKKVEGAYVREGEIFLNIDEEESIGPVSRLLLRGSHNWENITAAICAASLAEAKVSTIRKVVFSFKGLEHRLELAGDVGGIKFYNDSFATGPQPTVAAIHSFSEPITLILGGSDKGLDYSGLAEEIAGAKNVENIILIGAIGSEIGEKIIEKGYRNLMVDLGRSSMIEIVKRAFADSPKGGVVILSPAAASFDMFENYKDRGNQFKKAVEDISNE